MMKSRVFTKLTRGAMVACFAVASCLIVTTGCSQSSGPSPTTGKQVKCACGKKCQGKCKTPCKMTAEKKKRAKTHKKPCDHKSKNVKDAAETK